MITDMQFLFFLFPYLCYLTADYIPFPELLSTPYSCTRLGLRAVRSSTF